MNSESKTTLMDYLECITYGFTNPMSDTEEGPWKVTAKDIVDGNILIENVSENKKKAAQQQLDQEIGWIESLMGITITFKEELMEVIR